MPDSKVESRARLVLAGAAIAVFLTAFELKQPILPLGPVNFTTTELGGIFFYVTAIFWARQVGLYEFFSRRALDIAVLLFLVSNYVSVAAAVDKPSALKFALRMTQAALIYLCVSRLPQRRPSHLVIARALTVALLIVTTIGLMENFIPYVRWPQLLSPFQEAISTFGAFYNIRVASTLPFPTTLSMYLELVSPFALMLAIWMTGRESDPRRKRWLWIATLVGLIAVVTVQVFTFTRSGLVAMPVSLLAGAAAAALFGYGRRVWLWFIAGTVLLVVVLGLATVLSSKMATRLDLTEQAQFYGAEYALVSIPDTLQLDQQFTAVLDVKNTGSVKWKAEGDDNVFMSYRWISYPDKEILLDITYIQTYLPYDMPTGSEATLSTDFMTPPVAGRYVLVFDLVQSHVAWFSGASAPPLFVPYDFDPVTGVGKRYIVPEKPEDFMAAEPTQIQASRTELWRTAYKTWQSSKLLGVGPDQFRHRYMEFAPDLPPDPRLETHNILVQALTDTGVIGLAVMVFLLLSALWVQVKLVRNRALELSERYVSLALLVALVAYGAHGMLDYYLWQTGIAFLFFTVLGLTAWMDRRGKQRGD